MKILASIVTITHDAIPVSGIEEIGTSHNLFWFITKILTVDQKDLAMGLTNSLSLTLD
jgi:hypothetical protein